MIPRVDNAYRLGELSDELCSYLRRIGRPEHIELTALRERTAALPFVAMMQGAPSVGHLLQFLIRLTGSRHVLEVGVFTGCSTLAMATALPPDGRITAIDITESGSRSAESSGRAAAAPTVSICESARQTKSSMV